MTNTFQDTLAAITGQASDFESGPEKAVEMFVVLPLLEQIGWNIRSLSEINPQGADVGKVDFDLRINGESRILIEVKRWRHDLADEDEGQLEAYCQPTRPKLAVLTSGRVWRLYLAPTASRGQNSVLRKFEEVDITKDDPAEVVSTFRQFLARCRMIDFKPTLSAANDLYRKLQDYQEQKRLLTEAWNELASDKDGLTELVLKLAENKDISTSRDNVVRFLESHGQLVNEVSAGALISQTKPASFILPNSPTGSRRKHSVTRRNSWNNLLLQICELMQKRHPDSFRSNILSVPDRFTEDDRSKDDTPIGDTGVFAVWGGSVEIRHACYEVVTRFDYPKDSLVIKDSQGATL